MFINIHTHFQTGKPVEIINAHEILSDQPAVSVGIHPKDIGKTAPDLNELERLIKMQNCIAIGECGLDKIIDIPMESQITIFKMQLALAGKFQLPVILHCVKTWNEVLEIKKQLNLSVPVIFHGFRKTGILQSVLDAGLMISIGTAVLYDQKLQEIIPLIPDNRLLLETDSDPDHSIEEVYLKTAELKGISLPALQELIFKNFRKNFPKWEPPTKD